MEPLRLGVATSAFQIEGSVRDARVASIWDTFATRAGAILDGSTGEPACDSWRRLDEDVALLADLGVDVYRFSIAWPRLVDDGGTLRPAGLDRYSGLVDLLLAAGITPMVTLYHWDLPQVFQERGGWVHRDTAGRLADCAEMVAARLGDRVTLWTTINEPWCSAFLGYGAGVHAPGVRHEVAAICAAHHLLLGHGLAAQAIRAAAAAAPEVGIVLNLSPIRPASERPADLDAAERVDGTQNRLWLDALLQGRYPPDVLDPERLARPLVADGLRAVLGGFPGERAAAAAADVPLLRDGDLATIAQPLDLLGVNYYFPQTVAAGRDGERPAGPGLDGIVTADPPGPRTAMGWPIDPDGLVETATRLHGLGAPPLWITENGAAFADRPGAGDGVDDADRIAFLDEHLDAVGRARSAGVDVRGYLVWTLLDNFEWAYGHTQRFGLVQVDPVTGARTPKASYRWYQERLGSR